MCVYNQSVLWWLSDVRDNYVEAELNYTSEKLLLEASPTRTQFDSDTLPKDHNRAVETHVALLKCVLTEIETLCLQFVYILITRNIELIIAQQVLRIKLQYCIRYRKAQITNSKICFLLNSVSILMRCVFLRQRKLNLRINWISSATIWYQNTICDIPSNGLYCIL